MNLTANIGLGRSIGAAFFILPLSNQPNLSNAKYCDIPSVCSLPNGLRYDPEGQFAGQRCQLRVRHHVVSLTASTLLPKFHDTRTSVANERHVCTTANTSDVETRVAYTPCFEKTDAREIHLMEHPRGLTALSPAGAKEWLPCDLDYFTLLTPENKDIR